MSKIKRMEVIRGVYWVEVPEAGLFMLCGCPEDSVKHLMQRRLIVPTSENGVHFETGPNAILLSDVALQNGKFCNLAEFPVLQMLYRQGMIIPGHPNNKGVKPLILGSKEQVASQMEYIYRGNYGLVSKEEMMAAGVAPERAHELMRMKLKFAFGKILATEELLDHLIVENETTEIRNGVTITRKRTNVFEVAYGGESVTVDLTVKRGRNDRSAYPLGFKSIERDYFSIVHSGQGDGWDVNRPCMASIIVYQGKIYLIDAGPNISYTLTALGIGVNEIEGIFHTHCHDDHFAGLTSLMRTDHRIKYYATPLVRASVFKKLSSLLSTDEDVIPSYFNVVDLTFNQWNDIDGLEVRPIMSPHPVETSSFYFRTFWEGRYLTYSHLADIASLDVLKGMITDDDDAPGISQALFDNTKKEYLTEADLKKVDIGGGMIHGEALDFEDDHSGKIVLAHRADPLTNKQKEIGSSAMFGVVDAMVPDQTDNLRRFSFEFLRDYFPSMEPRYLRTLLNHPIVEFTPGSIILRKGRKLDDVYLILTGTVEKIRSEDNVYNVISAGGLVGELSGFHGDVSNSTYRTVSYVKALRLTNNSYFGFIRQNGLEGDIARLLENREVLEQTWLFGETISPPVQNKIAKAMRVREYDKAGIAIGDLPPDAIFIVHSGEIDRNIGDETVETLGPRSVFGEEQILHGKPQEFDYVTAGPCRIYEVRGEDIVGIPIVMWKLLETFELRSAAQQAGAFVRSILPRHGETGTDITAAAAQ
jgi:hemerythrin